MKAWPLALVIAPTRELACRSQARADWLYEKPARQIASCVGGMDMRATSAGRWSAAPISSSARPDACATTSTRRARLSEPSQAVVLDEADEMLDLGFREDLEFILDAAPEDRRTLMFSATVPKEIATLAQEYQRDAVRIERPGARPSQHADIEYRAVRRAPTERCARTPSSTCCASTKRARHHFLPHARRSGI
jgi:ATP-dependent RNA helicase DeaD